MADAMEIDEIDLGYGGPEEEDEGELHSNYQEVQQDAPIDIAQHSFRPNGADIAYEKVNVRGANELNGQNLINWAKENNDAGIAPTRVEWVDNGTANLIFDTASQAQKALTALTHLSINNAKDLDICDSRAAKRVLTHPNTELYIRIAMISDVKLTREDTRYNGNGDRRRVEGRRGPLRGYQDPDAPRDARPFPTAYSAVPLRRKRPREDDVEDGEIISPRNVASFNEDMYAENFDSTSLLARMNTEAPHPNTYRRGDDFPSSFRLNDNPASLSSRTSRPDIDTYNSAMGYTNSSISRNSGRRRSGNMIEICHPSEASHRRRSDHAMYSDDDGDEDYRRRRNGTGRNVRSRPDDSPVRELFGDRNVPNFRRREKEDSHGRLRDRSASPPRDGGDGRNGFPEPDVETIRRTTRQRTPPRRRSSAAPKPKDLMDDIRLNSRPSALSPPVELFPNKASAGALHRRTDAFDAGEGKVKGKDLFSRVGNGANNAHRVTDRPGFSIRGLAALTAASNEDIGMRIKGQAKGREHEKVKELFPEKVVLADDLFAGKMARERRRRAEDLF